MGDFSTEELADLQVLAQNEYSRWAACQIGETNITKCSEIEQRVKYFGDLASKIQNILIPKEVEEAHTNELTFYQLQVFEFSRLLKGSEDDPIIGPQLKARLKKAEKKVEELSMAR